MADTKRVALLDELRGLSILLMILYHGAYDLVYLFGWSIPALHHPIMGFLQPFFAGVFVTLSGMACRFSRNNLRRGLQALTMGVVLTLLTTGFLPGQAVRFGILHLLGLGMLVYYLVGSLLDALPAPAGAAALGALFLLTYELPRGHVGLPGLWRLPVSPEAYTWGMGYIVGLPRPDFYSSDYFPLVPWLFLFLAGACLGRPVAQGRAPRWFYPVHLPLLAAVGRRTLVIYLFHQPALYVLLWLFTRLARG